MQQRTMQWEGRGKSLWWPVSQAIGTSRLGQSLETAERGARKAYGAKRTPSERARAQEDPWKEGRLCQPQG